MSGSAPRSSSVAPEKSLENVVSSARKGRWTRNDSIDASIVGGLLEIVWRSASGSRPTASQVSAIVVNRCALVFEIGSTMRAASPSSLKKRGSSVPGSARLAATGSRCWSRRGASSTVRPTAVPRPANESPKPRRFCWLAARVLASNILKTSSRSTLSSVCSSGIVSPSW